MLFTNVIVSAVLVISHALGMTAAAISCPEGYVPIAQSCFQFVSEELEWSDAEANCEALGGHLAVLDDCSLFGDVVKHINAQVMTAAGFWIGASDILEESTWLWVTGESVEMGTPYWGQTGDSFQPSGGTSSNCLLMLRDNRRYFHDAACSYIYESICQTNPTGNGSRVKEEKSEGSKRMPTAAISCPGGYVPIAQSCFQFVSEVHTWSAAEANCEALGGHLAVLNDCSLFGDVVKRINAQVMTAAGFWIGASDVMEEGTWLWVTGESVEMGTPYWGQDGNSLQPNGGTTQNCLDMYRDNRHYFNDAGCSDLHESICQTNPTGNG